MVIERIPNSVSWANYAMSMAFLASTRSKDPKTKVGAVLLNPKTKEIFTGFNGCPKSFNDNMLNTSDKYSYVIHAEMNAMLSAGMDYCRRELPWLFVTFRPCPNCMLFIHQFGIRDIVYYSDYSSGVNNQNISDIIKKSGTENGKDVITITRYEKELDGELLFCHNHMGIKS